MLTSDPAPKTPPVVGDDVFYYCLKNEYAAKVTTVKAGCLDLSVPGLPGGNNRVTDVKPYPGAGSPDSFYSVSAVPGGDEAR